MLVGDRPVTERSLAAITTSKYRETDHPHLASLAEEQRETAIDLVDEVIQDKAITEYLEYVTWTTVYDIVREANDEAVVVARVIITERSPGDREKALAIENLPKPLTDILNHGLELPFRFNLSKEGNSWKINEFHIPELLTPLLQDDEVEAEDDADELKEANPVDDN